MCVEYYTNNNYNIKLYSKDDKWIIERKDIQNEILQVNFKTKQNAINFLKSKKYELYRIVHE